MISWLAHAVPPLVLLGGVAGLAFLADIAVVGLAVPGEAALILAGIAARRGSVSVFALMAVAAIGAGLGNWLSYEVGRRMGDRLDGSRLEQTIGVQRRRRIQEVFERWGAMALVSSQFVPIGAFVPLLGGTARMKRRSFVFWTALAAAAWSSLYIGLGFLGGQEAARMASGPALALAAGTVLVFVAGPMLVRRRRARRVTASGGAPDESVVDEVIDIATEGAVDPILGVAAAGVAATHDLPTA